MANKKLSRAEVAKRMIRLRNLEKLYRLSKQRRDLQGRIIANLEELVTKQQEVLEQQDRMLAT